MASVRILCVDDEPAIRETLPAILRMHGFEVTCVGTVSAALGEITSRPFDVLVSDLNIGQPGDGFTVVSAMRRTHPECVNFILTGYPALETALQAIRGQVDDYLIKPANVPSLVAAIQGKLKAPKQARQTNSGKRISAVLRENASEIIRRTLAATKADPALAMLPISDEEHISQVAPLLEMLADVLDTTRSASSFSHIAEKWGTARHAQGYDIKQVVMTVRLLEHAILDVVHENLLLLKLSYLMHDLKRLNESFTLQLEETLDTYLRANRKA